MANVKVKSSPRKKKSEETPSRPETPQITQAETFVNQESPAIINVEPQIPNIVVPQVPVVEEDEEDEEQKVAPQKKEQKKDQEDSKELKKAFDTLLNPPLLLPMNEHLKKLKKKVHDSIVEPGRGVIVGSGILGVDLILQRGVNFGSAHEFSGFSKAGKSYVMQKISAMAQRVLPDCYVVFYDRENAYDITRVLSVGLDANRTIIVPSRFIPEPDHLFEQMRLNTDEIEKAHRAHLENPDKDPDAEEDETLTKKEEKKSTLYCRSYDKKKSPHIIHVIDSIPSFSEQDKIVEDQGRRAKKWHSVMRRITGFLDPKILVLFSNHYIYKPGMYGGSIQKSSGTALDLYRDSGLKLMYQGDVQDKNGMTVGSIIGAEVDKTRRGPAAAYTFFPLYFKDGAPQFSGILPYMEYLGLAEVTNKTAVASSKTFLWPRYRVTGFSKVISEEDSDELEDFVRKNNVLGLIAKRERETIVGC